MKKSATIVILSLALNASASAYFDNITNLWYTAQHSNVLALAHQRLAANANDKGTLFAGASYSGLVLAGWTLAMNRAFASGFEKPWAAVVDAHVHYAKAIAEDVVARAEFAEAPNLVPGARNWAKVRVTVGEKLAFEGTYAVGVRR